GTGGARSAGAAGPHASGGSNIPVRHDRPAKTSNTTPVPAAAAMLLFVAPSADIHRAFRRPDGLSSWTRGRGCGVILNHWFSSTQPLFSVPNAIVSTRVCGSVRAMDATVGLATFNRSGPAHLAKGGGRGAILGDRSLPQLLL